MAIRFHVIYQSLFEDHNLQHCLTDSYQKLCDVVHSAVAVWIVIAPFSFQSASIQMSKYSVKHMAVAPDKSVSLLFIQPRNILNPKATNMSSRSVRYKEI